MRKRKKIAVLGAVLLFACSDYALNPQKEVVEPVNVPNIQVVPSEINFGHLNAGAGETKSQVVIITNLGNDLLDLDNLVLSSPDVSYSFTTLSQFKLEANEATRFTVTYTPTTFETNTNAILIGSNDPNDSIVTLPLVGASSAPVIEITPDYHDFGVTYIGCVGEITIDITNVGDSNLIVSDVRYYMSYPPELSIEVDTTTYGAFPWSLASNETRQVTIYHEPYDLQEDYGYVEVHSNDPATPIAIGDQEAFGDYYAWAFDFYEQDEVANADILFVIDNSGSMHGHQTNLINNFDSFINVFAISGVDYQLAFITTDNENFVEGEIITSADPDPVADVNRIIGAIGIGGSALEHGLLKSYDATQAGKNAGPGSVFLRTDSRLVVIYVSDEPDGSSRYSTLTPADYVQHLLSLKPSADQVISHAVAGDHPSGCSPPYAQFGDGYYDVVQDLGGTFMSICAPDYGTQMDAIARDSILLNTFKLTETPFEDSIIVTVDGVVVTDWVYDVSENAVVFDLTAIPAVSSEIYIDYAVLTDCES